MRLSEGVEWGLHCAVLLAVMPPDTALPTSRLAEFHGVPVPYPLYLWVHWVQQDLLDRDGLERPKNADDYKRLALHFTQPNNDLYGIGVENNVGMGATNDASETNRRSNGSFDPEFTIALARAHEENGWDRVLTAYGSGSPDPAQGAAWIAMHYFRGTPISLALMTMPAVAVIVGEVWLGLRFLGDRFEELDVSEEFDTIAV